MPENEGIAVLSQQFKDHAKQDESSFERFGKLLEKALEIAESVSKLSARVGVIENDVSWLKKGFYVCITLNIATFLGMLYQLIKPH
jgi:hypothetical protein